MDSAFTSVRVRLFMALCTIGALTSASRGDETQQGDLLVPYEPTHPQVVQAMLKLAGVTNEDYVIDLGCGDGRIIIAAAKTYETHGFGMDLDPQRIREARDNAAHEGVAHLVQFDVADIMVTDIRKANVVTLYLLNRVNLMVRPKLFAELEPGARVVSNSFHMDDWEPDAIVRHPKARGHFVYFWVIPAPVGGTWRWTTEIQSAKNSNCLVLEQEFQGVSGTVTFPNWGEVVISDASINGKDLTFAVTVPLEGRQERIVYRGTVEGDAIRGTQEWLSGASAGTRPWTARRDPVDLTGGWKLEAPLHAHLNGTLQIDRNDGKLIATYVSDADSSEAPLAAFYAWGSSIRFEVPTGDSYLVFTGSLGVDAGEGTYIGEGWSAEQRWWARRLGSALDAPREKGAGGLLPERPAGCLEQKAPEPFSLSQVRQTRRQSPQTEAPSPGDEYVNPTDGSVLVWIAGGDFLMGSDSGDEDERPAHKVEVEGFWLGRFEVTNSQYAKFIEAEDAKPPLYWEDEHFSQPDQPVVGVTWLQAKAYCEWARLRLPTEAEWEYAAVGGRQLQYPTATGEISHALANTRGTEGPDRWDATSPVGSFPPNPFGLHDMAGNAWEWTNSKFAEYPYSPTDGREEGDKRVLRLLRGGSWYFPSDYCRTAHRHRFVSHLRYDYAGIRVALTKQADPPSRATAPDDANSK